VTGTTLQTPRSVKMEGRRCSRCRSRDSPAACGADHGGAGCVPAAYGGPPWSVSPPAARAGPHAGASACLKEAVTLRRAHARAGSWQDQWTHGERSPCCSRFAGRACDPVGEPGWSSLFLKDCNLWNGPTLGQFTLGKVMENCLP